MVRSSLFWDERSAPALPRQQIIFQFSTQEEIIKTVLRFNIFPKACVPTKVQVLLLFSVLTPVCYFLTFNSEGTIFPLAKISLYSISIFSKLHGQRREQPVLSTREAHHFWAARKQHRFWAPDRALPLECHFDKKKGPLTRAITVKCTLHNTAGDISPLILQTSVARDSL